MWWKRNDLSLIQFRHFLSVFHSESESSFSRSFRIWFRKINGHRTQNTGTHIYKITNVPVLFIWHLDLMISMEIHYSGHWRGWALKILLPFQGQKSRFSGPTPFTGPFNGCCPHQNHYVRRHINNGYINSY